MSSVGCRVEHIVSNQTAHKPVEIGEGATVHMLQPDEPFTPLRQTAPITSADQVHQHTFKVFSVFTLPAEASSNAYLASVKCGLVVHAADALTD